MISDLPEFVQTIVKQLIGNALIPAGAAERLTEEKYAQTKAALSADGLTWQNADLSKVNWGFSDGDMEGFIDALIAGLRPVTELVFGMQLLSLVGADIALKTKRMMMEIFNTDYMKNYSSPSTTRLALPMR